MPSLACRRPAVAGTCLFLALAALGVPVQAAADPASLLEEIRQSSLDVEGARQLGKVSFAAGPLTLSIEQGLLFPASRVGGHVVEMVFLGTGTVRLEAPDSVEAGQLELFTGRDRLDEPITEAVFAIANDAAVDALLQRSSAVPTEAERHRAEELYQSWKRSLERRLLNVEAALIQDGLEDPLYQGFFAGWFEGVEIGKVLYAVEPDSQEQVSLGKFVPAYLNAQERKRAERRLDREQRRGRRLGVEVEHLGSWDTWLSTSLRSKGGEVTPGFSPFEPRRYQIDLSLDDALEATGKARVELEAMSSQARFLRLKLNPDLRVDSVLDARGEPLFFLQNTAEVLVVLPQALAAGDHTVVEVQYQGRLFEKADTGDYAILDSINWHPHAGTIDRAAFDVTFHWPARLELAASGKLVAGGQEKGGRKWQRRTVERPSSAFGFELGRFSFKTRKVGHVEITLALSPVYYAARDSWHRLVLDGAAEALEYFEQIYGPYPFDELTVATSPRGYSQSLVGFVSVSRSMMGEGTNSLLGLVFGFEDPRTILAHEVAHQWWGHVVGWESYRDQWLSEAMANYSAMLFARERLKDQLRWGIGPASRWQENLSAPTRDGRPREAIGPLVLGERLSSTRSESAYQAIVYQKGALVLNTLAQQLSVDRFKKGLAELIRVVDNREISTANFFELLGRITAEGLAGFEQRFVRGTGLPDLTYTYRFEPTADGHWQVIGHTEQRVVRLLRYRLRRRAGGDLDVAHEAVVPPEEVLSTPFSVPFQVSVWDPASPSPPRSRKGKLDPRAIGNLRVEGRIRLNAARTDFSLPLDHEPKEFWLDPKRQIFARTFNAHRTPKRALFYQALDLEALGQADEARAASLEALQAPAFVGPVYEDTSDQKDWDKEAEILDGRLYLLLARLDLDAERDAEAEEALAKAEKLAKPAQGDGWVDLFLLARCRMALHRGEAEKAFWMLAPRLLLQRDLNTTEAWLLLAIAAQRTSRSAELALALEAAAKTHADVSLLRSAAAG